MSTKRYNKDPEWKTVLEELVVLPGEEPYNVRASWNRLEGRLHGKRKFNKILWYRVAAACIICCGIFFLVKPPAIKDSHIEAAIIKNPGSDTHPGSQARDSVNTYRFPGKSLPEQAVISSRRSKKQFTSSTYTINKIKPVIEIIVPAEDSLTDSKTELPVKKPGPIVFSILKNKLPVIHLNDLEKPVAPVSSMAENNLHPVRIRIFEKGQSTSSDPGNNTFSDGLKIKFSPQN